MTWLILDNRIIKLKRDADPNLYRAIYKAIRLLKHQKGLQNVTPTKKSV